MMHECAKIHMLHWVSKRRWNRNQKATDTRYPERMLDLRLAQPRWTTVLLEELDTIRYERGQTETYSGNTLITLPPSRL